MFPFAVVVLGDIDKYANDFFDVIQEQSGRREVDGGARFYSSDRHAGIYISPGGAVSTLRRAVCQFLCQFSLPVGAEAFLSEQNGAMRGLELARNCFICRAIL